jgi:hypothetical protein
MNADIRSSYFRHSGKKTDKDLLQPSDVQFTSSTGKQNSCFPGCSHETHRVKPFTAAVLKKYQINSNNPNNLCHCHSWVCVHLHTPEMENQHETAVCGPLDYMCTL